MKILIGVSGMSASLSKVPLGLSSGRTGRVGVEEISFLIGLDSGGGGL